MRFGLQARYLTVMLGTLAMLLAVLAGAWLQQRESHRQVAEISRESMHELAVGSLAKRGEAMASLLADTLTNPLYYFDLVTVGEITRSALRQSDVSYVIVFDGEGRVVHDGSADIARFGQPMQDAFSFEAVQAAGPHVQWTGDTVDVVHPIRIGEERLGGVRIGLSLAGPARLEALAQEAMRVRREAAVGRHLAILAGLFAALVVLGLLLSQVVARGLVRPIQRLAEAAREVEGGNFDLQLGSRRQDELGDLIRAFGRMGESVKR